jgi:hypothetical protein
MPHTQSAKLEYLANPNPMNEHVGVDDEGLYIDLSPNYPLPPPNPQSQGGSKEREGESSGVDDMSQTLMMNPLSPPLMMKYLT